MPKLCLSMVKRESSFKLNYLYIFFLLFVFSGNPVGIELRTYVDLWLKINPDSDLCICIYLYI